MAKQNLTVFQKLTQTFGYQGKTKETQLPSFQYSKKDILKTDSKEDFEKARLQAQQSQYISDKWSKLDQSLYNQSVYYEPNRLSAYYDFESMEFFPEISAALDIYAEESCLDKSTVIPLLNGENTTIKELFDKNIQNFWVYGVDVKNNQIKPSLVEKVIYKGKKSIFKIILDDDSEILCTDNHRWLNTDNEWIETKDISFGTSLKSIYSKKDKKGYEKVSLSKNNFMYTHTIVAESELFNDKKELDKINNNNDLIVVHHRVVNIEYVGVDDVYDLYNSSIDSSFGVKCNNGMIISHNCTPSEKGDVLTIFSDSKRIKNILVDLFENTLDINTNLQLWARGMCKYGDDFVYLKIDSENGIVGCQQLPNIEIERIEGASSIKSTLNIQTRTDNTMPTRELRFAWKNKDMEFQAWEIAHFRILGDDRKLPYGTSMLDKVRRIWKQLMLAEDAMLIYRTSRAPERRVFKIFVGNMDDKDIEPYVQRIANKFKRDQVVDPRNGNVDMRYNQMSVDQDYFIPVRDPGQASPIETLPGAQNLGEIADIEYIQKKLLAALRIPKAFLGFEEVVGDGKNLALMDIRFARTINKIQKSLIQELNKIALIHLYLLGLEDELNNFTLTLTNPSAQSDLLKIEQWKEKVTLYKDATTDQSQIGILPVSHTWAKRNILGMSDNEIILDLQQQRLERAIGAELMASNTIIKRSGVFDDVDKKYGIPEEEREKLMSTQTPEGGGEVGASLDMGAGDVPTPPASGNMGNEPLMERNVKNKKIKILSMLNEDVTLDDLFDMEKAQKNIHEIEQKINDILND